MTEDKIVLIGGSAGSLEVILHVLPNLKTPIDFPIVIVLHRKSNADTTLAELFSNKTSIPVKEIDEKEQIKSGMIYIAPPDYHTLIEKDKTFSLDFSEKVNYSRPGIDVTFQTAAEAYGQGAAAILLSGANADGTSGLDTIKAFGGITIVQSPQTAEVDYMPSYALSHTTIDKVLDKDQIADFLNSLSHAE